MKMNIRLYLLLKPHWDKLEQSVKKVQREYLQAKEFEKAEIARKSYHERLTAEKLAALRTRPDQDICTHRKGGRIGDISPDYALTCHTHVDAHREVKCMVCGKQFDPKDPETLRMLSNSTNFPSSSEITVFNSENHLTTGAK